MSTIVFRDGIMAADTRAYSGNASPIGFKQKIHRLKDGSLIGCSTTIPGLAESFIAWMNDGGDPENFNLHSEEFKFQALHVKTDGSIFYYLNSTIPSGPLFGAFFAIGSGEQYALGALTCGATADAAVMAAAQHDAWTGGDIMKIALHPEQKADNDNEVPDADLVEEKPKRRPHNKPAI